ncbi:hypothetical protein M758_3G113500 [Ceratodon purpureus]|nr:hypothetical protein M758_3G113500 [Ceratodon purpureus]
MSQCRGRRKYARAKREEKKVWEPALFQFPPLHTFGFSGIRWRLSQIACLNSQTVVFPIGCGLYMHRDHCSVPVLPVPSSTEKISCVAVSESGLLMAVCEKHKGEPSTRLPMLDSQTTIRKLWWCAAMDLLHSFTVGTLIYQGSCCAGPGIFKIWSLAEEDIESGKYGDEITGLEEPGTGIMEQHPETGIVSQKHGTGVKCILTDHVWLIDNSVAIATENKVIFIVKDCEITYTFLGAGHILCLAPTPTGFYAGRKDGVIMQIFGWDIVLSEFE